MPSGEGIGDFYRKFGAVMRHVNFIYSSRGTRYLHRHDNGLKISGKLKATKQEGDNNSTEECICDVLDFVF